VLVETLVTDPTTAAGRRRVASWAPWGAAVVVAFLVRLLPILRGGGVHFYGRYDDGVYYAAADALTFGRMPYRDFTLLHPPGGILALTPFAAIGRLTSDAAGMTLARLTFMLLGGIAAVLAGVLAARIGRDLGPARVIGPLAALLYACSPAAAYSEQTTFLEPIGGLLVLLALLLLSRRAQHSAVRIDLLAGLALGLACTVKIWYVAPAAAVVAAVLLDRRWDRRLISAMRLTAGGAVGLVLVLAPFVLTAPGDFWRMVVTDQLGRSATPHSRYDRLTSIVGTKTLAAGHPTLSAAITVIAVILAVGAVLLLIRERQLWPVIAVLLADVAVLFGAPSYFRHYGVLLAAPLAVVVACALGRLLGLVRVDAARLVAVTVVAALALASGAAVALGPTGKDKAFPPGAFARAPALRCVASDDPAGLIQSNRLSADLARGCPVAIDVTGTSYGEATPRHRNLRYQTWLVDYLLGSDAFVLLRPVKDGLTTAQLHRLQDQPTIARAGRLQLRAGSAAGHR